MGQVATRSPAELPPWLKSILIREYELALTKQVHNQRIGTSNAADDEMVESSVTSLSTDSKITSRPLPSMEGAGTGGVKSPAVASTSKLSPMNPLLPALAADESACLRDADRLCLDQFVSMDFSSIKEVEMPLLDPTTLVLADRDRDGLFSREDVFVFALHVYSKYCKLLHGSGSLARSKGNVKSLVTGELVKELWERIVNPERDGVQEVASHICSIFIAKRMPLKFASQPGILFVDSDSIHTLYEMMSVARSHRKDFQSFFDLLQQSAEDKGLMDLEEEEFDDVVPLEIIREFITNWLVGFCNLVPLQRPDRGQPKMAKD